MQMFVIINNIGIIINTDVNKKIDWQKIMKTIMKTVNAEKN